MSDDSTADESTECHHCEHGTVYVERTEDHFDEYPCDACGPVPDRDWDTEIDRKRDDDRELHTNGLQDARY